jgi:hypothetical protein
MLNSMKRTFEQYVGRLSRRDLFRRGSVLAAALAFFGRSAEAAPAAPVSGQTTAWSRRHI